MSRILREEIIKTLKKRKILKEEKRIKLKLLNIKNVKSKRRYMLN